MSELKTMILECAGCTAPLSEAIVKTGVHKCPYCGYVNILPKEEQSSEVVHHLRNADSELKNYEFERAYNEYAKAAELDSEESKAYFGMALAANRVKYIKDVVNNRWQAICCEITDKKFTSDPNYQKALAYATDEQRAEYASRAKEIDYIREKFVELQNSGLSYDTFICVKVSDGQGGFTQDSVWAGKLYDNIKKAGMKPFYSEREIGDRTGEDYEALILYALYSAKSMLIVCSNEEYLRTPWVQNEYTRYYSMMSENDKQKNSIMIAFSENVVERIPTIPGKIQGVELHSFDASQKINEFVSRFANAEERARKAAEEKAKREAELLAEKEAQRAKEEANEKARLEQQRMLEELQRKINSQARSVNDSAAPAYSSIPTLLKRVFMLLEDKDWSKAGDYCDKVLDIDPENAEAYLGRLMYDLRVPCRENLKDYTSPLDENINFKKIMKFGSEELKNELFEYNKSATFNYNSAAYDSATKAMQVSISENDYKAAAKKFADLGDFKDSCELAEQCLSKAEEIRGQEEERKAREEKEKEERLEAEQEEKRQKEERLQNYLRYKEIKKKKRRKILKISAISFSVAVVIALIVLWQTLFVTRVKYEKVDGGYAIYLTKASNMALGPKGTFEIPSTYKGEPVVAIKESCFSTCGKITEIIIPDSVTSIGYNAFDRCTSLRSITIPSSVTSIGTNVFYLCSSLGIIYCEASSKPSGWSDMWTSGCSATVNWGSPLENFVYEISYSKVTVTGYTGNDANVIVPSEIDGYPVTTIGENAFSNCTSLVSINIPDSVTTIEKTAFSGCTSLEYNEYGNALYIGNEKNSYQILVKAKNTSITSCAINESTKFVCKYAFENCTSLTEINFNATAMNDLTPYNFVFSNAGKSGNGITVNIGNNVTKIPDSFFYVYITSDTPKITSVVFEKGSVCESIGESAFAFCFSLTSITIPDSVTSIEYGAFSACTSLQTINCEAESQPSGWKSGWNGSNATVNWGYAG